MALPRSPRTSFDLTIDLNVTDVRTYDSSTYYNKHIRIIPKTSIDAGRGLVFWSASSVTIIGGHFKPAVKAWGLNASGSKAPGTLNFNNCGEVYLEGVLIDNANLIVTDPASGENGGDAVFLSGKSADTNFVVQNCAWINVRGVQTLPDGGLEAHGDIFQTGSRTQGKAGDVFFYNFTGSGDYQGFFLDPQTRPAGVTDYPDGGMASLTLNRVNLKRTAQKTLKHQLLFLFSSESAYESRGYPANFQDVWLDGLPGDTLEDTIWPANRAASNGQFTNTKYQASIGTDDTGRYAEWAGLRNAGKQVLGKVYQGSPSTGDYVPVDQIGIGYVQGAELGAPVAPAVVYRSTQPARFAATTTRTFLDIRRTLAGTSVLDAIVLTPIEHGAWTQEGVGTMTVNSPTSIDLLASGGGSSSARVSYATEPGQTYALTFTIAGQPATVSVGSTPAANNLNAGVTAPIGANTVSFVAVSSISHVKFATTVAGTMFLSDLAIAEAFWATGGPGTVTNQTATTVSLVAVGGSPTFARRALQTLPGETYRVTWTSSSATGTWAIGSAQELTDIAAPAGSFVVGPNATQFTATTALTYFTFQRTGAGTADLTAFSVVAAPLVSWTGGGAGTVTVTSDTSVTLNAVSTTATQARRTFDTSPSRKYAFNVAVATNAAALKVGTTAGGGEIIPSRALPIGPTSAVEFVSDTTPTHVELSRSAAGASTLTGLTLAQLSTHAWYSGGPGSVFVSDNNTFSLAGTGGSATFVQRPIPTVADREYLWTFNVSGGSPQRQVGSASGSSDLASLATCVAGVNSVRFPATSHQAWLRIQQTAASSAISVSGNNFILLPFDNSATWTISGTGATTIDAAQTVTINGNGTTTAARRSYNTIVGKAYELLFNVSGGATQYQVGTTEGGTQVVGATLVQPGTISVKFTATTATTHFHCQRVSTGATVVTKPVMSLTTITNAVTPTATSFNAENLGGVGKPYYFVDRLSDSATDGSGNRGSLRYCLTAGTGADRLILSEMQGVINRTADLGIGTSRNNITIAGYTGPGPLVLRGSWNFQIRGQFHVIEHLAFEREYHERGALSGDGMQLISAGGRDVHHILVRNCYTAHSQDEAFSISRGRANDGQRQADVSVHWSVFTNPLKDPKEYNSAFVSNLNVDGPGQSGDHNFNLLVAGYINNVDIQRNLIANALQRNPRFSAPVTNALVANNVIVNWGYSGISFHSETDDFEQVNNPPGSLRYKLSIIGNIGIPGPNTTQPALIAQHAGGRLGGDSLIHISNNSIVQGLNAAVVANANTIGFQSATTAHYPEFPGPQPLRQDTLPAVLAIAQARLLEEMDLNVGPFPKLRRQNPNLLRGVTQAVSQMKREIAGRYINHEAEGPGMSVVPTISRPLTGNLAPPADHTNVPQVQAWLRERRLEVAYD